VPVFKIFVGWRPNKLPKVPFSFGLEGTLYSSKLTVWNAARLTKVLYVLHITANYDKLTGLVG